MPSAQLEPIIEAKIHLGRRTVHFENKFEPSQFVFGLILEMKNAFFLDRFSMPLAKRYFRIENILLKLLIWVSIWPSAEDTA